MPGQKKLKDKSICISMLVIVATILLLSKDSFLHGYNAYPDFQFFVTMGKSLRAGQVIYRDVFDHKGPAFLFLTQFFFFNQFTSFVYDIITIGGTLFIAFSLNSLGASKKIVIAKNSLIVCFVTYIWKESGSPEQSIIAAFMIIMWMALSVGATAQTWAISGLLFGYIFYTKFSLAAAIFPMFVYFVVESIKKKELAKHFLCGSGVFIAESLIVFAYFYKNKAFSDFIECYFIKNLGYQTQSGRDFGSTIVIPTIAIAVMAIICLREKEDKGKTASVAISCAMLPVLECMLSGRSYNYYMLAYVPAAIYLVYKVRLKLSKKKEDILMVGCFIIAAAVIGLSLSNDKTFLASKDEYLCYQIARDLNFEADGTLTIFSNEYDIGQYLPANNQKYHVIVNQAYKENKDMYETVLVSVQTKDVEYVGVLAIGEDREIRLNANGWEEEDQKKICKKILDAINTNYSQVGEYGGEDGLYVDLYKRK